MIEIYVTFCGGIYEPTGKSNNVSNFSNRFSRDFHFSSVALKIGKKKSGYKLWKQKQWTLKVVHMLQKTAKQ